MDAIDTFQSQHGGRVFSAPDSGEAPLGSEMNSQVVCPQHIEAVGQKNVAFPSGQARTGEKRVLSNFSQSGHPQEMDHIIAIVRPQGVHLVAKFQANRSNGSVCAGPSVFSGLPVPTYVRHSQTDDVSTGLMLNARSRQRWQGFLRVSCLRHLWLPNGVAFCEIL